MYIYIRIDFFPADVVVRGANLSFRLRYHSCFFPHDQPWWISAAKDMKEAQSDMDSATSMLEKADSKKDKLEATAKVLGWLMETEGCFGAIFFTGWSRKQRVMVRILSGPICSGMVLPGQEGCSQTAGCHVRVEEMRSFQVNHGGTAAA